MRLAFIAYLHGFGGAEKQIINLANAMYERGYDVYFISLVENNVCYNMNDNIKKIFIEDSKDHNIIKRFLKLRKVLKEIRPDVSINYWYQSAYYCTLMSKKICGSIVYSERGDPGDVEYSGLLGIIRRITLPRIDYFVFQSRGAQSYFNRSIQNRSTIIYNPVFIDKKNLKYTKNRDYRIVNVGRLHAQKNQKLLIEAFERIANDFPKYSLEIYGEGELHKELSRIINEKNLSNRVFLKGSTKEIYQCMCNAALFVLTSDYEGTPNALIEAMILGVPSISTDCSPGGAREIIINDKNGIIVPKNDVDLLTKEMRRVLLDNKLSEKLSDNSKKIENEYDPKRIYDSWDLIFNKLHKRR